MSVITIFGSGTTIPGEFEYDTAEFTGKMLGEAGFDIASGGYYGVMEAVSKGAANNNGRIIAVLTDFYSGKSANPFINEQIQTETYIDRLLKLIEIGDSYIVFPGSTGTLLELAMIWTLKDRGIISNKLLICIGEQWSEVIQTMGFYSEGIKEKFSLIEKADSAENAIELLKKHFNKI